MKELTAEQFWTFSLNFYAKPEVASACIQLQDTAELNVNLILFCRFLDGLGIALTNKQIQQLAVQTKQLDDALLQTLRHARRNIPNAPLNTLQAKSIKKQLLSTELSLEKIQQEQLVNLYNSMVISEQREPQNMLVYISSRSTQSSEAIEQSLKVLLQTSVE